MSTTPKPAALSTPATVPYWEAAAGGQLLIQHCRSCGHLQLYPRTLCAACWSPDLDFREAKGTGTVWTHSVIHQPGHTAWLAEVPFVLAIVELDEGPRLMTNIVDVDPDDVHVGQRVRVQSHQASTPAIPRVLFVPVGET